jgi:hypothetical protein
MDWNAAIEKNREALKRVMAMLVAMAGLEDRRATLPRHLHRAILSLLRPAEAAARRLIIVAARGLVVTLAPARKPKPYSANLEPLLRHLGIAITISPDSILPRSRGRGTGQAVGEGPRPRTLCLPLFDPPRRIPGYGSRRSVPAHAAPRILLPGIATPHTLPPSPSPDDPIDATRLALRLAALSRALDNLPREAMRFARWRAARHASAPDAAVRNGNPRFRRIWPLRPGRPPGGRLARYDPDASGGRRNIRDIDEILAHANALALYVLSPDTS